MTLYVLQEDLYCTDLKKGDLWVIINGIGYYLTESWVPKEVIEQNEKLFKPIENENSSNGLHS